MKVSELKTLIERHPEEQNRNVIIKLSLPSLGPIASEEVASAYFGFDWDKDLILTPAVPLVPKENNQSVFEAGLELLIYLATKPSKKESYETRTAKHILMKYGYTEEQFEKYRSLYHK